MLDPLEEVENGGYVPTSKNTSAFSHKPVTQAPADWLKHGTLEQIMIRSRAVSGKGPIEMGQRSMLGHCTYIYGFFWLYILSTEVGRPLESCVHVVVQRPHTQRMQLGTSA